MTYKKCPKCQINLIKEGEDVCSVCKPSAKQGQASTIPSEYEKKYYSHIECGKIYGTKAYDSYVKFCHTLNWDWTRRTRFSMFQPLHAECVDTTRERSVWYISNPVFDEVTDPIHKPNFHKIVNRVLYGGNIIREESETLPPDPGYDRIIFVRKDGAYVFYGVHKLVKNGSSREYKRFSKVYPVVED